jgi:hypothetical protein
LRVFSAAAADPITATIATIEAKSRMILSRFTFSPFG